MIILKRLIETFFICYFLSTTFSFANAQDQPDSDVEGALNWAQQALAVTCDFSQSSDDADRAVKWHFVYNDNDFPVQRDFVALVCFKGGTKHINRVFVEISDQGAYSLVSFARPKLDCPTFENEKICPNIVGYQSRNVVENPVVDLNSGTITEHVSLSETKDDMWEETRWVYDGTGFVLTRFTVDLTENGDGQSRPEEAKVLFAAGHSAK